MFETAGRLEEDAISVPFLNTIGCVAGIGFAAAESSIDTWQDQLGVGFAIYGCVTVAWSPAGTVMSLTKTAIDLAGCAFSFEEIIRAYNDYESHLDSMSPSYFETLFLNSISLTVGCGITGLQTALGK
jgi:hypothetical protein